MSDARYATLTFPGEENLTDFFGAPPLEASPSDGFWLYKYTDSKGFELTFSFNIIEKSIQCSISVDGRIVSLVLSEMASKFVLENGKIRCQCVSAQTAATFDVTLEPAYIRFGQLAKH